MNIYEVQVVETYTKFQKAGKTGKVIASKDEKIYYILVAGNTLYEARQKVRSSIGKRKSLTLGKSNCIINNR